MPRYPNPDDQRINRTKPQFSWKALPRAGRPGPAPKLPAWRTWDRRTKTWWRDAWASPQATMWKEDGSTMLPFALVMDDLIAGRTDIIKASPEIRQHQDRHGLNPKAMLQLRWRIEDEEASTESSPSPEPSTYAHLRAVKGEAG